MYTTFEVHSQYIVPQAAQLFALVSVGKRCSRLLVVDYLGGGGGGGVPVAARAVHHAEVSSRV